MAKSCIDAGALSERIEILALRQEGGSCAWETVRRSWARAELSNKRNNFSVHGIGASGVTFTIRRQELDLGCAIRWRGRHCFLTGIAPTDRLHLTVEAALVVVSSCEDRYSGVRFPGIMTEKYLGHQQLEPMAVNVLRHVLVTPKRVALMPGRLVDVDGTPWPIRVAHTLDPWKNEYEIERTVDL